MVDIPSRTIRANGKLTHFQPMSHFYAPWKHQEIAGFLMFSWGIEVFIEVSCFHGVRKLENLVPLETVVSSLLYLLNNATSAWLQVQYGRTDSAGRFPNYFAICKKVEWDSHFKKWNEGVSNKIHPRSKRKIFFRKQLSFETTMSYQTQ